MKLLKKADIEFFKGGENSLDFLQLFKLMVQMRNSITGQEEDNLISPVRNNEGIFFDTKAKNKRTTRRCRCKWCI